MSFYEYYRFRLMRQIASIQAAFALNYIFKGSHLANVKAGFTNADGKRISGFQIKYVRDIIAQSLEIAKKRPAVTEQPLSWRSIRDIKQGVSEIERQLGYAPSGKASLLDVRQALMNVIEKENQKCAAG